MTGTELRPGSMELSPLGTEALDTPVLDRRIARATLRDIARANRMFGGHAAVVYGVKQLLDGERRSGPLTVADVGAGAGDVLVALERVLGHRGIRSVGVALDWHREAAAMARERRQLALVGDAFRLPLADRSADIVVASQLLHHCSRDAAVRLVQVLDRAARIGVVIADLRRSQMAAWGIGLAATLLRFHPVSRADGMVSVRRGYSRAELAEVCRRAGADATVRRRPGFRLVAYWRCDRENR